MGKKQINKQLKIFISRVKENYHPEKIILFGSYAENKANKYSDVDLMVIAKSFQGMNEETKARMLFNLTKDLYPDFHVYGFIPDEAKRASNLTTLGQALKSGVALKI